MQASAGSKADAVESFASLRRVAAELAATAREVRAESVAVIEEAVALRRDTVALLAAIVLAKRLRDDALRVGILLEQSPPNHLRFGLSPESRRIISPGFRRAS